MELTAKPDFEEAKTRWRHFWNGEVYKRPLVLATVPKEGMQSFNWLPERYYLACTGQHQTILDHIDRHLETTDYLGEAMPAFPPNYGPDQFAAFLGAEFKFSPDSHETNWVDPIVDDWDEFLPIEFNEENPVWQGALSLMRKLAEHGRGRYLTRCLDAHSHADTLLALRGGERFSMDFIENPEQIERAMEQVRPLYPLIFNAMYEAGEMGGEKGSAHLIWSDGKAAIIQCDYIIMIGSAHFRQFILPAIEEEAEFLDHTIFHLDGVGAFRHLDDLLGIKKLGMIQLVPGAGGANAPAHTYVDLLKKCLAAGKGVQVHGDGLDLDRIKVLHRELGPKGVMYCPTVKSRKEVEEIMHWLEANT